VVLPLSPGLAPLSFLLPPTPARVFCFRRHTSPSLLPPEIPSAVTLDQSRTVLMAVCWLLLRLHRALRFSSLRQLRLSIRRLLALQWNRYFILHRVSTIHRFQLRVIVCFHARLQSRRTSRRVYSLSLLWLCLVSRLRLRIRLIRFHLRIHLIRLCIKRVYHRDHHRILHQQ